MKILTISLMFLLLASPLMAKVDLVTLPDRDTVQLTIYNSADLTLARESRPLTLNEGLNQLQFSWANTLIDPTSLEMLPLAQADKIDIADLTFPPRMSQLGLWNIQSRTQGNIPVEISYFTSGISWRAFYMATLAPDEATMHLEGYVRVTNNSGEDYENAQVRLVVGQVHLLDEIAALANRKEPFGRPGPVPGAVPPGMSGGGGKIRAAKRMMADADMLKMEMAPKEITKEGISEYFLYTIEGRETIPNGWSKRLLSFDAQEVPIVNLYKYEQERYGLVVVRFLSFKNDTHHKLGSTPIPGGELKAYRQVDAAGHLSYEGQSEFKYIPINEDVELNIGAVENVVVEPKLMDTRTDNYLFDAKGNISGWDEIETWQIEVKNTRPIPVKVEVHRNFAMPIGDLAKQGDFDGYEKVDLDTIKFTLTLKPQTRRIFSYVLTLHHGQRAD